MMRTLLLTFASLLTGISCLGMHEAVITGQITHHHDTRLMLKDPYGRSDWSVAVPVSDGAFTITLLIDQPVMRSLSYGNVRKNIYLEPGRNLQISFDALQADSTFRYTGELAAENIILDQVVQRLYEVDYGYVYSMPLDGQAAYLDTLGIDITRFLMVSLKEGSVSDQFGEYARDYIRYYLATIKMSLAYYEKDVPAEYYAFTDQLSLDRTDLLEMDQYRYFLSMYLELEAETKIQALDSAAKKQPDALFYSTLEVIEQLENKEVREYALYNTMVIHLMDFGLVGFEPHYDHFIQHNTSAYYAEQMERVIAEKGLLASGQPAPAFTLVDTAGELVSLSDFRGRYVYLDFWQTLCPRSGKELPHLLQLHTDYAGDRLAFVSISVNEDPEAWRAYVREKKQMGTSLWSPGYFDSQDYADYQVNGLPAFILIDPEGNIIDAKAPKPSTSEIRETLDQLLSE